MIYGHPSQQTPMLLTGHEIMARAEAAAKQLGGVGHYEPARPSFTPPETIDEQIARNRWEEHLRATVEQVTWTRRIYWLLWGVIVPPQLILGIWLIMQLVA